MRASKIIHVVTCHAACEVGDVIVGDVAPPPGGTLWEQFRFIANDGVLRNFLRHLAETGVRMIAAANEQFGFSYPEAGGWNHISFCQFAGPFTREDNELQGSNAVVVRPRTIDRSRPGWAAARMAALSARGLMTEGDVYRARSLIGSEFVCRIARETTIGGRPAIVPIISGRAWITGLSQYMLDLDGPWPCGYRLTDTWPRLREAV